jgi:hypothetical protein
MTAKAFENVCKTMVRKFLMNAHIAAYVIEIFLVSYFFCVKSSRMRVS